MALRGEVPVLVFGAGITALGVVRAFGRRGTPVYVVADDTRVIRASRWYRAAPTAGPAVARNLAVFLDSLPFERAVLLPCSDDWARRVAVLPDDISLRFPASVAQPRALSALVDKGRLAKLLDVTGVPHPRTFLVETSRDAEEIGHDSPDGAFVKPRDSQSFFRRFGVKAFRAEGREDLRARLNQLIAQDIPVVVQEYIPGPASNHYFVDGFIDSGGCVRARFARRRLRMHPPWFGNSSYMISVELAEVRQGVEALERVLGEVAYRGIFSVELKLDERDGQLKILEVNARPWWYVEFAARCGVDVCALAYDDALGRQVNDVEDYRVGRRLVYSYYDFFACVREWRNGDLGLIQWAGSWLGSQRPVFTWDDPGPALVEGGRFVRRQMSRRVLRRRSGSV